METPLPQGGSKEIKRAKMVWGVEVDFAVITRWGIVMVSSDSDNRRTFKMVWYGRLYWYAEKRIRAYGSVSAFATKFAKRISEGDRIEGWTGGK